VVTGSRALFGREVGWLDRSLVLTCAAGLAITVLAGLLQVRFGSYPVTFRQVVAAVFDPLVWLRPNVLASFLPGDGLTGALGFERSFDLPTETLIV
jgi:iron complex transport system permease protein